MHLDADAPSRPAFTLMTTERGCDTVPAQQSVGHTGPCASFRRLLRCV